MKIYQAITATLPVDVTLHFLQNTFLSHIKNSVFMWMQDCFKQSMHIDSNMIRTKQQSHYMTM